LRSHLCKSDGQQQWLSTLGWHDLLGYHPVGELELAVLLFCRVGFDVAEDGDEMLGRRLHDARVVLLTHQRQRGLQCH
jgi:hypothetical protein